MIIETAIPTLLAEGTRVQGSLTFFSGAGVYGIVEGEVVQQSLELLQVGRTGWIHGSIQSQGPILVEGKVDGDLKSAVKIFLAPTASVKGKITAPSVEIKAGAIFEGELSISQKASAQKIKAAA